MIKVPATPEGIPAIEPLISEGINVNVTLLFAQEVYEQVAHAYIAGLERRAAQGGDLRHVASVASFFISRIDTAVDAIINERLKTASGAGEQALLRSLLGKVAIANAKQTYQRYQELFRGPRWQAWLARARRPSGCYGPVRAPRTRLPRCDVRRGAHRSRYRQHHAAGDVRRLPRPRPCADRLTEDLEEAYDTMDTLAQVGISMAEVTNTLLDEGVQLFAEAFDKLLAAVEQTRQTAASPQNHPADIYPACSPRRGRAGVARRLARREQRASLVGTRCHPVDGDG